jgi:hypothetical protein
MAALPSWVAKNPVRRTPHPTAQVGTWHAVLTEHGVLRALEIAHWALRAGVHIHGHGDVLDRAGLGYPVGPTAPPRNAMRAHPIALKPAKYPV